MEGTDTHLRHTQVLVIDLIRNEYFMTINIFVLKGDLNGKIVVVRFFFCWVYFVSLHVCVCLSVLSSVLSFAIICYVFLVDWADRNPL